MFCYKLFSIFVPFLNTYRYLVFPKRIMHMYNRRKEGLYIKNGKEKYMEKCHRITRLSPPPSPLPTFGCGWGSWGLPAGACQHRRQRTGPPAGPAVLSSARTSQTCTTCKKKELKYQKSSWKDWWGGGWGGGPFQRGANMEHLKGVSHEIFRALFWHVWIDLGLNTNLWLFLIFSVEPLILYLRLKFRRG